MATPPAVIPTIRFSEAKAGLSDLMNEVVHGHRLRVVDRHNGKEEMILAGREELLTLLEAFSFQPKVSVSDGEFVVHLAELGLVAGGASFDEALDELVELSEAYAEDYLDRLDFFKQTDRRGQLPWVARVALTPHDARKELFTSAPRAASELQPA